MFPRPRGGAWPPARAWSGRFVEPFGPAGPAYLLTRNFTPVNYRNPSKPRYWNESEDPGFGLPSRCSPAIAGRPGKAFRSVSRGGCAAAAGALIRCDHAHSLLPLRPAARRGHRRSAARLRLPLPRLQEAQRQRFCCSGALAGRAGCRRRRIEALVASGRQRQPDHPPFLPPLRVDGALQHPRQVRRHGRHPAGRVRRSLFRFARILRVGGAQARLGGNPRPRRAFKLTQCSNGSSQVVPPLVHGIELIGVAIIAVGAFVTSAIFLVCFSRGHDRKQATQTSFARASAGRSSSGSSSWSQPTSSTPSSSSSLSRMSRCSRSSC